MASTNEIVTLNVGGHEYTTTRATLLTYPDSMLAVMFSDRMPSILDDKGRYFIDRDGEMFIYILRFLRSNKLVLPKEFTEYDALNAEADFYHIPALVNDMIDAQVCKKVESNWKAFILISYDALSEYRRCWYSKVFYQLHGDVIFKTRQAVERFTPKEFNKFTELIVAKDKNWYRAEKVELPYNVACTYLCYLGADFDTPGVDYIMIEVWRCEE